MSPLEFLRRVFGKGRPNDRKCPVCGSAYSSAVRFCSRDGATLEDPRDTYDAFVSYRRDGGSHTARLVRLMIERLSEKKLFLDVDELGSGRFDERLLAIIGGAQSFILILSPRSLDRCNNPDDWMRREILHALARRRKIIPVFVDGFTFPSQSFLRGLPEPMADLPSYQAVVYDHQFADSAVRKILRYMGEPATAALTPSAVPGTTSHLAGLPAGSSRPTESERPTASTASQSDSQRPTDRSHQNDASVQVAKPGASVRSELSPKSSLPIPAANSTPALNLTLQNEEGRTSFMMPAPSMRPPSLGSATLTITAVYAAEQGGAHPAPATNASKARFLGARLNVMGTRDDHA